MNRQIGNNIRDAGDARMHRPDFDDLALFPARRVDASPAAPEELPGLIALAQRLIPPLSAAEPAIRRVYRRNPDSIWAVRRPSGPVGVFAMLLLTEAGADAMRADRFDTSNPPVDLLTGRGETAAAIYLWAIATPGLAIEAFKIVSLWLRAPAFARADVYTRTTTPSGARFAANIGFEPLPETGLLVFRRHRNRTEFAIAVA